MCRHTNSFKFTLFPSLHSDSLKTITHFTYTCKKFLVFTMVFFKKGRESSRLLTILRFHNILCLLYTAGAYPTSKSSHKWGKIFCFLFNFKEFLPCIALKADEWKKLSTGGSQLKIHADTSHQGKIFSCLRAIL